MHLGHRLLIYFTTVHFILISILGSLWKSVTILLLVLYGLFLLEWFHQWLTLFTFSCCNMFANSYFFFSLRLNKCYIWCKLLWSVNLSTDRPHKLPAALSPASLHPSSSSPSLALAENKEVSSDKPTRFLHPSTLLYISLWCPHPGKWD